MQDIEKFGTEFLGTDKGKKIKELAKSKEGRELEKLVSGSEIEKAVRSGDVEALKGIMTKVLATEQGKRIAEELTKD